MPRAGQIKPKWDFAHIETYLNDNTVRTEVISNSCGDCNVVAVFASPRGRDNRLITNNEGLAGFIGEYGRGSFFLYGQPYMNAYAQAASEATTMHCLRVSAADATYANNSLYALYKIAEVDGVPKLVVKFKTKSIAGINSNTMFEDYAETLLDGEIIDEGWTAVPLMSFFCAGKGEWGNPLRVRISTYTEFDAENEFKNYLLEVYESGNSLTKLEEFPIICVDDATVNEISMFPDTVINDPDAGSTNIEVVTNIAGFEEIYEAWAENVAPSNTTLTKETFDVLLGIDKTTQEGIVGYEIDLEDADSIVVNALTGIQLQEGDDGAFGVNVPEAERKEAMAKAYLDAFAGITDEYIKSKRRFPSHIIFDANFDIETKKQIGALTALRADCMGQFDMGTALTTKRSPLDYNLSLGEYVSQRCHMVDAYWCKVKDPVSKKHVKVTSTYLLSSMYPIHFQTYGAKHIPLAGSNYGVLSGFVKNTLFPVYDEDIDAEIMQQLTEKRINFASINSKKDFIRHSQITRQDITSDLSEANAMFIVLDIKRDCERLCEEYSYEFSDEKGMSRFNADAEVLLSSYQNQVDEVSAYFDKTEWESENNILHLYVNVVNKDLVKNVIIEIDVNK